MMTRRDGRGFVDIFDTNGNLIKRLVQRFSRSIRPGGSRWHRPISGVLSNKVADRHLWRQADQCV